MGRISRRPSRKPALLEPRALHVRRSRAAVPHPFRPPLEQKESQARDRSGDPRHGGPLPEREPVGQLLWRLLGVSASADRHGGPQRALPWVASGRSAPRRLSANARPRRRPTRTVPTTTLRTRTTRLFAEEEEVPKAQVSQGHEEGHQEEARREEGPEKEAEGSEEEGRRQGRARQEEAGAEGKASEGQDEGHDKGRKEEEGARPGRPQESAHGLQLLPGRLQERVQEGPPGGQGRGRRDQGRERALEADDSRGQAAL